MADEVLKRLLIELAFKMDDSSWSKFNSSLNAASAQINKFGTVIDDLGKKAANLTSGTPSGGGVGGGGFSAFASLNLPGLGNVGALFRLGPMGALAGVVGVLGAGLQTVVKHGFDTIQMFSGLYYAAQRAQVTVGSLVTAKGIGQIFGLPIAETEREMGMQFNRYPWIRDDLKKRFGVAAKLGPNGEIKNLGEIMAAMGRRWRQGGPERYSAGEQEAAAVYKMPSDVYAQLYRDPEAFQKSDEKLREAQRKMGLDPDKLAEDAKNLQFQLTLLDQTLDFAMYKPVQQFVDYLNNHRDAMDKAFDRIEHFIEIVVKVLSGEWAPLDPAVPGGKYGPSREKEDLGQDPGWIDKWLKDHLPSWMTRWYTGDDTDQSRKDSPVERQTGATEKQTKATDKSTDEIGKLNENLVKINATGGVFASLETDDTTGGGGGGGGRRGGGTVAAGRGGGGGPLSPEDWERAGSQAGALTARTKAAAIKAAGGDNAEAQRIFQIMQGVRLGEGGTGSKYPWNPNDPSGGAFGPWQFVGGGRFGSQFQKATGKDFRDPRTIGDQADYMAKYLHAHPGMNVRGVWHGYRGPMAGSPKWGELGYHPLGAAAPIGTAGGSPHHDSRDQSLNQNTTINVTGFDDPHTAGRHIASALDNTQKGMVRDFRTKFA